jgi:hypothetical protein
MIRQKDQSKPIVIDLTGPEGNAFCLLGYAKRWAADLGLNYDKIRSDMTSGDYENLVQVMDKNFGSFVIFER